MRRRAAASLFLALAGCPRREPAAPVQPPGPASPGPRGALPDGGMHHTARLAWSAWLPDGGYVACGRRTADFAERGAIGACLVAHAKSAAAASDEKTFAREAAPVDAGPGACRILLDDAPGDPGAPPARATLIGGKAPSVIDSWKAPREVDGDYFAVETSLSPDGKWLAVAHVTVGLGEDRLVEVRGLEVRPAPRCE